jgi:hypothetical protein
MDGAELYVPPGTLNEPRAEATIRRVRGRGLEFTVQGAWHGRVRITMPAHTDAGIVMHDISGTWVEQGEPGQRTVWVNQLSVFSWLGGLPGKVASKLCLTLNPKSFISCLLQKGLKKIDNKLLSWLAGLAGVSNQCAQDLIASGGFVSDLWTIITSSACEGQAGETGPVPTLSPASAPTPPPVSIPAPTPTPVSTPAPPLAGGSSAQPPTSSPEPSAPPSTSTEGFFIEDDIYGGTWARTDPGDGTWYPRSAPPPNGAYWYPNDLGVAVSCAESAAPYEAVIYGVHERWTWWAHVTDGKWVPTVVFSTVWSDGLPAGLGVC